MRCGGDTEDKHEARSWDRSENAVELMGGAMGLVNGGCSFIGSNFIHYILKKYPHYSLLDDLRNKNQTLHVNRYEKEEETWKS